MLDRRFLGGELHQNSILGDRSDRPRGARDARSARSARHEDLDTRCASSSFWKGRIVFYCSSPPRGNMVGGLPRVQHWEFKLIF